ncbi:MAG: archaetidylserine decarboxylase [Gammaproteobacteria bacterium]|nr:archaetidylserine decarboxylase [Gammaproteobacteria bacterium]
MSANNKASWKSLIQYPLPHHALSRVVHWLTRLRLGPLTTAAIKQFVKGFKVDLSLAVREEARDYDSFNDFFTRALKVSARPVDGSEKSVVSPVDGAVSQAMAIEDGRIFQAKGHSYTAAELLGSEEDAEMFSNGSFATIYLSPRDYHRIHMPLDGELSMVRHVPGRLFSVNTRTTAEVPGLFARNERVVTIFDTPAGKLAVVMVGAIFVGSIETVWAGEITPPRGRDLKTWHYGTASGRDGIRIAKGKELGRFNMGSTVILLAEQGRLSWDDIMQPGAALKMGQRIGKLT